MRFLFFIIYIATTIICRAQYYNNSDLRVISCKGDTINVINMAKDNNRLFVILITDWDSICRTEISSLYLNGVIDLCKTNGVRCVAITDKRSYTLENFTDSLPWKKKISTDFEMFINVEKHFSAPSTIIIEPTGELSYYQNGHHREKELENLKDWIIIKNHETCKTCNGSGVNPNECKTCGGTGRCKFCEMYYNSHPDHWGQIFNCPSCHGKMTCNNCKGNERKAKRCPICTGIGKVVIKK